MENTIRTFQVLGPTSAIVLSGINIGASLLTLPILYTRPPSISTPIFYELYRRDASLFRLELFSVSCFALVFSLLPSNPSHPSFSSQNSLWLAAAYLILAKLRWAQETMRPSIEKLGGYGIAAENEVEREKMDRMGREDVVGLLRQWTWMNFVKGGISLAAGIFGLIAIIWNKK